MSLSSKFGEGLREEELRAQLAEMPPNELTTEIARIEDEIGGLQQDVQEAAAAERDARRDLEAMQEGDGAAASAQQVQDLTLELKINVERWLRNKAAKLLLERAIERYRAANEHPLVRRAGQILMSIAATGDNPIQSLRIDYADADRPVLVGVRRMGRPVT